MWKKLNARLFESRSHARITAERMAMESLEYYFNDLCAVICLTWDQIESSGVAGAELEDLTSLPRSIEGSRTPWAAGSEKRKKPLHRLCSGFF